MAESYQEYVSIDSFLNARLCMVSNQENEYKDLDALRSERRRLYRQLDAFGINKNLFKQHPKSYRFFVTSKAAALFTSLLNLEAEGKCGRPFNPKKLNENSVLRLRKQLLDALLSYHVSHKDIVRTIRGYDKATGFPGKCMHGQLEQYPYHHVKPKAKPTISLTITPEPIVTNPPSVDLSAYHLLIDTGKFNSLWQIDCADLPIFPSLK